MSPTTTEHRIRLMLPHVGQRRLRRLMDKPDMKILIAVLGRRWGKTTGIIEAAIERMIRHTDYQVGWFSHLYSGVRVAWEELLKRVPRSACLGKPHETTKSLRLLNGSRIQMFTAENPDAALGRGFNLVIIDEAARVDQTTVDEAIMPMLMDRDGSLVAITTPKGKVGKGKWVFRDYKKADLGEPGYYRMTGPSTENPMRTVRTFVKFCKRNLPTSAYDQEIGAQFLDYGLGVLDLTPICTLGGTEKDPIHLPYHDPTFLDEPEPVVCGLDLAKTQDYTVITALGKRTRTVRGMERFHRRSWPLQVAMVRSFAHRYGTDAGMPKPTFHTDATGVGQAIVDLLEKAKIKVNPVVFTNEVTTTLVQNLQLAVEQQEFAMPYLAEPVAEATMFEAEVLKSGRIRYGASEGFTDDCVYSLGLALYGLFAAGPPAAATAPPRTGVKHGTPPRKGGAFARAA